MTISRPDLTVLRDLVGAPATTTAWECFDQAAVDAYAAATGETLWVHTDPIRAASSRFGGTIVPSSLLMARFGHWLQATPFWLPEPAIPLNYGYDRVRIPGALPVGAPVRGRIALADLQEERPGTVRLALDVTAERQNTDRPVVVARWIVAFLLPDPLPDLRPEKDA